MLTQLRHSYRSIKRSLQRSAYVRSGRKPFTPGYYDARSQILQQNLSSPDLLKRFAAHEPLPVGYGVLMDERVVEYPWVFSHLTPAPESYLLDAGSTFNNPMFLTHPLIASRKVLIYTLAPEGVSSHAHVSYLYGDLRNTVLKSELVDKIVCISTLEHIGMDNTRYTGSQQNKEQVTEGYRQALYEFHRLLKPGGELFITVPYGQYENFGWFQQFDARLVQDVVDTFSGQQAEVFYYRYTAQGWNTAQAQDCTTSRYASSYRPGETPPGSAVAASAVACLKLTK